MANCIMCGVEVDPDTALSIVYQRRTYYFDSPECKNRFFLMIYSGEKLNRDEELLLKNTAPLNFGEFPDPNDLKTHGDIDGWTDKKYL